MNKKKGLLIVLTLVMSILPIASIKANTGAYPPNNTSYTDEGITRTDVYEWNSGNSQNIQEGYECTPKYDEYGNRYFDDYCYWWSEDFVVQITLTDNNMNIIENEKGESTKTVIFKPYNPYSPFDYNLKTENFYDYEGWAYLIDDDWKNYDYNSLYDMNPNETQNIFWPMSYTVNYSGKTGMSIGAKRDQISDVGYYIYMGYGEGGKVEEKFDTYQYQREAFTNYIKSMAKEIHIVDEDNNIDTYINFIDFFLHVCGFTDEWNYTSNSRNLNFLFSEQYQLVIEPMFTVGAWKNRKEHRWTASAKFIGNILWANNSANSQNNFGHATSWDNPNKTMFGPNWFGVFDMFQEPRFNFLCSFYDESSSNNQANRMGLSYEEAQRRTLGYKQDKVNFCKTHNAMGISSSDMANYLGYIDSPFGVNTIRIGISEEKFNKETDEMDFMLDTRLCEDDSFTYELKINETNGESIFNIVDDANDAKIEAEKNKLSYASDLLYHYGEGDEEVYCYDDVKYDFDELKRSIDKKIITAGKLREMPNGKLIVNRTCYYYTDKNDDRYIVPENIRYVFNNDPGEYQDEFTFKFGNDTYQYRRVNNPSVAKIDKNYVEHITENSDEELSKRKVRAFKYTGTITYDYEISNSHSNNLSISTDNLQISNELSNTNSVEFISQYDKSRYIFINNPSHDLEEFKATLSANMDNAFGLSNKLYNELKKQSGKNISITSNPWGTFIYNLYYSLDETTGETCETPFQLKKAVGDNKLKFRVIDLDNPFPGRDGRSRMPGVNWVNDSENNVYDYIQNNRGTSGNKLYTEKEPLYEIVLDPATMIKVREYNKGKAYSDHDITCEENTGRKCISNFLRTEINNLQGTCSNKNVDFYECADKTEKSGG